VLGLVLIGFAVAAAVAPPFSGLDTLPHWAQSAWRSRSFSRTSWSSRMIGFAIGAGGVLLIITVGAALLRVLRSVF